MESNERGVERSEEWRLGEKTKLTGEGKLEGED